MTMTLSTPCAPFRDTYERNAIQKLASISPITDTLTSTVRNTLVVRAGPRLSVHKTVNNIFPMALELLALAELVDRSTVVTAALLAATAPASKR